MQVKCTLQELAEFISSVAYSDNLSHHIDWRLSVINPKTNDGDVEFSGSM